MANPFDEFDQAEPASVAPTGSLAGTPFVTDKTNPFDEFDQAAPAATQKEDIAGQFGAGLVKGIPNAITETANAVEKGAVDLLANRDPFTGGNRSADTQRMWQNIFTGQDPNKGTSYDTEKVKVEDRRPYEPASGKAIRSGLDAVHLNPDDYFRAPATPGERIAETAGEGAITSIFSPNKAKGVAKLGQAAADFAIGAAAGAGAQGAMEVAPEWADPLVGLAAGLGAGVGTAGLLHAGKKGLQGIGKTWDYLEPAIANRKGIEKRAGRELADVVGNRDAAISSLGTAEELVPGSKPTAFQATGDVGLGSLEAALARGDDTFKRALIDRIETQNAARVEALDAIQESGNSAYVSDFFRGRMRELEDTADELYKAAEQRAKGGYEGVGERPAGEIGEQARGAMDATFKRMNAEANKLWNSIDPDKTMTVRTEPLVGRVSAIYGRMSPEEALSLSAAEKNLASIIAGYEGELPFSRFKDLRSEISRAMREANSFANPNGPAYNRLKQLRSAVEESISDSINGKMQADPSLADDFVTKARDWYERGITPEAGTGAAPGALRGAAGASRADAEGLRAGSPEGRLAASTESDTGLPSDDAAARRAVEGGLDQGAKTDASEQQEAFRRYMSQRTFKTRDEAERTLRHYIDKWNQPGMLGTKPEQLSYDLIDDILVRRGNGFAISNKGLRPNPVFSASKDPIGEAPDAAWGARDLQDYRKTAKPGEIVDELFVSLDSIPKAKLAGGKAAYSWDELERGGAIPPVTLRRNKNGTVSIIDGNHRIEFFRERGYDSVPAYVIRDAKAESALDQSAHDAATSPRNDLPEPTDAQKAAGNYAKGHVKLGGLDISIENPVGSKRRGADKAGKPWEVEMKDHYGYLKGTIGKDKDHIDTFVKAGTNDLADDSPVFVVDQVNPETGRFDEHKVLLGYPDKAAAEAAYRANYAKGWQGMREITPTTVGGLKRWLGEADTKQPFATQSAANIRASIPKFRGGATIEKIQRTLKTLRSDSTSRTFKRELRRFSSPQEAMENLYWHGTGGYIPSGLKAGSTLPEDAFRSGGYGEEQHSISLSKSKEKASNFTGDARSGSVYPVALKRGAVVETHPEWSDAMEVEDALPELWDRGVDAVRVGDWSSPHSEQELVVLNPRALALGKPERFSVFQKKKFDEPMLSDVKRMMAEDDADTFDQSEAQSVADTMAERFAAAGRPKAEAEAAGQIVDAFYTTMAKRLGKTVDEVQDQFPLPQVRQASDKGGGALDQPAWHGSPHKFDKFSNDKMGSGEGNQSFGWGTYLAGKREVAEYYRDKLSAQYRKGDDMKWGGKTALQHYKAADRRGEYGKLQVLEGIMLHQPKTEIIARLQEGLAEGSQQAKDGLAYVKSLPKEAFAPTGGRLYKVDIPDDAEMLQWDKPLSAQPPKVKEALKASGLLKEFKDNLSDFSSPQRSRGKGKGENLYSYLEWKLGGPEAASKRLMELGIPGHKYPAGTIANVSGKGHNYVIYDDSKVNITEFEQGRRGSILDPGSKTSLINLFEKADASTAVHESAHQFMEMFRRAANEKGAPEAITKDWRAVNAWYEKNAADVAKEGSGDKRDGAGRISHKDVREVIRNGTTGDATKDRAVYRGMQEQWARAFETYLKDGKAPNAALKNVFEQFKDWLGQVYRNFTSLNVKMSPEIRQVFDQMLGGEGGGAPSGRLMDKAAADRFSAATASTRELKDTFGAKPVKQIMKRPGPSYPFDMSDEAVVSQLWKAGPEGAANIQNVTRAGAPRDAIEAAAVLSAKRSAGKDGVLDPAKFDAWRNKHADALREVPALDRRLSDAASATKAMVEMGERHATAIDSVRKSAVGKLLGVDAPADISSTIGSMLNRADAVKSMRQLASEAAADPEALDGLRRAVVDHMLSRLKTPKDALRADTFQRFLGKNTPALRQVLTPEQMNGLRAIAQDLKRASRDRRAPGGGSDTAENLAARNRYLHDSPTILQSLFRQAVGSTVTHAAAHLVAPGAGSFLTWAGQTLGGAVVQQFRAAGIRKIEDLIKQAVLDPELMRTLLMKAPKKKDTGSALTLGKKLANIVTMNLARSIAGGHEEEEEPRAARPRADNAATASPMLGVRG